MNLLGNLMQLLSMYERPSGRFSSHPICDLYLEIVPGFYLLAAEGRDGHVHGCNALLLRTEPRTFSLTGFEPARKRCQGGPVSTAAMQSQQHPSHSSFRRT